MFFGGTFLPPNNITLTHFSNYAGIQVGQKRAFTKPARSSTVGVAIVIADYDIRLFTR
jgi:hypothetical protein